MSESKKCWACGKTLTGGEKIGLCDSCLNKFGTPVATLALIGGSIGIGRQTKNGRMILKTVTKIIRRL